MDRKDALPVWALYAVAVLQGMKLGLLDPRPMGAGRLLLLLIGVTLLAASFPYKRQRLVLAIGGSFTFALAELALRLEGRSPLRALTVVASFAILIVGSWIALRQPAK